MSDSSPSRALFAVSRAVAAGLIRVLLCVALASGITLSRPPADAAAASLPGTSAGMEGWHWQWPLPTGVALNSVDFVDQTHGWAVGRSGTILRTTDGGETWVGARPEVTTALNDVDFADSEHGWAVGDNGVILYSADGGVSWRSQVSRTAYNIREVLAIDADSAVALIHYSNADSTLAQAFAIGIDGGDIWTSTTGLGTSSMNSSRMALSLCRGRDGTVWAPGQGGYLYRFQGGVSWSSQSGLLGGRRLNTGVFFDGSEWWLGGYEGLWKTSDGGANATLASSLWGECYYVEDFGDGNLIALGSGTWASTDGGATWVRRSSQSAQRDDKACFVDPLHGWLIDSAGVLMRTVDGGYTWTESGSGRRDNISANHFSNESVGTVVGDYGIIRRTTDGGATWTDQSSYTSNALSSVDFINPSVGWTVGAGGTVRRTLNGGAYWSTQNPGVTSALNGVDFVDPNNGWAVGATGVIRRTANGGATWTGQNSGTSAALNAVRFVDANTGWVVGDSGVVRRTADGGATWVASTLGTARLTAVDFVDSRSGWVVSEAGAIYATANGGASWTQQPSGVGTALYGVDFLDASRGWAVGANGVTLETDDGGANWYARPTGSGSTLRSVRFVNSSIGWAVGSGGTILRHGDTTGLYTDAHAVETSSSAVVEPPVIVFVGGLNSKCKNSDDDELFGHLREYVRGLGYVTVIAPSAKGSKSPTVIDSTHGYDDTISSDRLDAYLSTLPNVKGRRVVLVGHSMGGLISRSYAKWWKIGSSQCEPIAVVQLGTPNAGSPAAAIRALFPGDADAHRALSSWGSRIDNFNDNYRNAGADQVPVYQVAGTAFPTKALPITKPHAVAWAAINAAFLLKDNDGCVAESSVFARPTSGVRKQTSIPALHTRSFPLGLWAWLPHVVPSGRTGTEADTQNLITRAIREAERRSQSGGGDGAFGGGSGGGTRSLQRSKVEASVSATTLASSEPWKQSSIDVTSVPGGESVVVPTTIEGTACLVAVGPETGTVEPAFRTSSGGVVPGVETVVGDGRTDLVASDLTPGDYHVTLANPGSNAVTATVVVMDGGDSDLHVWAPPAVAAGQLTTVTALVDGSSGTAVSASITAKVNGGSVALSDNGVLPDAVAGDKVYGGFVAMPSSAAVAEVEVVATGTGARGSRFRREAILPVDIVEPRAALSGSFDVRSVSGLSGKVATLAVDVGVAASADCTVHVVADLTSGGQTCAQPGATVALPAGSETTVTLAVATNDLVNSLSDDGAVSLDAVALFDVTDGAMSRLQVSTPRVAHTLPPSSAEYAGMTFGVVGSTPTSRAVVQFEGEAVCTTETLTGARISLDDGLNWFPVPTPSAGWSNVSTWTCSFELPEGAYTARAMAQGTRGDLPQTDSRVDITVDRTAPDIACDSDATYSDAATVTLTAVDGLAGLESIQYRMDGGATQTVSGGSAIVSVRAPGTHVLTYSAADFAGNRRTQTATFAVVPSHTSGTVTRIAGSDRFAVAATLARKGWDPTGAKTWPNVKHVLIANGEDGKEADALSAAGLAGVYDCPVLTVQAARVPAATKTAITEIARKNPGLRIHIIGGVASVPDARWNEIKAIPGVSPVKDRIAGADRYSTSAAIANRVVSAAPAAAKSISGVILIAGDNPAGFYDALAASPIAFARTMPMLSVKKGSIPPGVAAALNSTALKTKPRYAASSASYIAAVPAGTTRLTASSNRYVAAAQIADKAIGAPQAWTKAEHTGLAAKLPDALTGGTFLGKQRGVMLFTDSSAAIQAPSKSFITARKAQIANGWVIGGSASVPVGQETSFRNLLR